MSKFNLFDVDMSIPFPIVTAYDFEVLHEQKIVENHLSKCSVYAIVQRLALYFDEIDFEKSKCGVFRCVITDGESNPVYCEFEIPMHWRAASIEFKYFNKDDRLKSDCKILKKIEGIQIKFEDGRVEWICPTDFISRHYKWPNSYKISGDISPYLRYKMLYVGQSVRQKITKRLSNHRKFTQIITLEEPLNRQHIGISREVRVVFFEINISNVNIDGNIIANEVEAALINIFRPKYNKILFKNYPSIKNGLSEIGMRLRRIKINSLPLTLETDNFKMKCGLINFIN